MSRFFEKTNNPNLYNKTYWGTFKYNPDIDRDVVSVFKNRDKFASELKLKKVLDKSNAKIYFLLHYAFNGIITDDDIFSTVENCYYFRSNSEICNVLCVLDKIKYDHFYDHVEVYETTDGKIVILSSPYTQKNEEYCEFLSKTGFIDTEKLYADNAVSFYKIYDKEEISQIKPKLMKKIKEVKKIKK